MASHIWVSFKRCYRPDLLIRIWRILALNKHIREGRIGLQIIFEFPSPGSLEKDKAWFYEHVTHCSIKYVYKESI